MCGFIHSVPTPMEIFRPQQQALSREPSMQHQPPAPPHSVMFATSQGLFMLKYLQKRHVIQYRDWSR